MDILAINISNIVYTFVTIDSLGERVVECLQTAVTLEDDFDGIGAYMTRNKQIHALLSLHSIDLPFLFFNMILYVSTASEEIQQAVPVQTRTLAQELTEHTELLNNLYVLEHYLDNTVLPAVYTMCNEVKSIGDEALLDWAIEYEQVMCAQYARTCKVGNFSVNCLLPLYELFSAL